MNVSDVLAAISDRVPYLRATTAVEDPDWARAGGEWRCCAELLTDRSVLADVVARTMDGFGTDDAAVAASLFTQAYAFRALGIALAADALDLPVPDVRPDVVAIKLDKPRPTAVALLAGDVARLGTAALVHQVVDTHLAPFVDAVHDRFLVGERLLWGDVAASCAAVYRAVAGAASDPVEASTARARGEAFIAAAGPLLSGTGAFTTVRLGDAHGWYWDRTSCCLWWRTQHGAYCDNCSLHDPGELAAARHRELEATA